MGREGRLKFFVAGNHRFAGRGRRWNVDCGRCSWRYSPWHRAEPPVARRFAETRRDFDAIACPGARGLSPEKRKSERFRRKAAEKTETPP